MANLGTSCTAFVLGYYRRDGKSFIFAELAAMKLSLMSMVNTCVV
jgi:hypothetical protein